MFTIFVIIAFGATFLFSGLIVNFFQLLNFIFARPFSRRLYRRINSFLADIYWSQIVWLVDTWGRLEIKIFIEPELWEKMGTEHAILICNHRSDVDWAVGWVLAQRRGCLGETRALMKKEVQFLPVVGWSMWFSEYIFLSRNWAKDKSVLEDSLHKLKDFPGAMFLALFAEGTRFTEEKLMAAQEFALSAGLHVPKHTLVPRTKGFVSTVRGLRDFVPAIYDISVMFPAGVPRPTFLRLFQRKASEFHVHIRRVPISELPTDEEGLAKWCRDTYELKDNLLDEFKKNNTFDESLYLPMKPSILPSIYTLCWFLGLLASIAGLFFYILEAHISLNWTNLFWTVGIILGLGVILQSFLVFTQSEHSTPASRSSSRVAKEQKANGIKNEHQKPE